MKKTWCLQCGSLALAVSLSICPYCGMPLGKRPFDRNTKRAFHQGIARAKAVQKKKEASECDICRALYEADTGKKAPCKRHKPERKEESDEDV